ncbi:hypothetical protein [Lacihabitans soyangensis]|uniref:Uncharacterized protein n=1 Tax=Lacihabitans soyangensis TaxID=869394 RepID=A0AAE3H4K1_9BACT|nr:hypothetical protein [Lacihabitans soyangensis]MCP9764090.1 hypothetical protein [Lacihabitans soyangensis]
MEDPIIYLRNARFSGTVLAVNQETLESIRISAKQGASEISTFVYGSPSKSPAESTLDHLGIFDSMGFVICSKRSFDEVKDKAFNFLKSSIENPSFFSNL